MGTLKALPDRTCPARARQASVTASRTSKELWASFLSGLRDFRSKVLSLALRAQTGFFFSLSGRVLVPLMLAMSLGVPDAMAAAANPAENGYARGPTRIDLISLISPGIGHMLLDLSHIIFLIGIFFFLIRLKHIGTYLSLFVIGHFMTMVLGIYFGFGANIYFINAMMGLSMVYKAMDNFGLFQCWNRIQQHAGIATLVFAAFHGIGLATNILDYQVLPHGIVRILLD